MKISKRQLNRLIESLLFETTEFPTYEQAILQPIEVHITKLNKKIDECIAVESEGNDLRLKAASNVISVESLENLQKDLEGLNRDDDDFAIKANSTLFYAYSGILDSPHIKGSEASVQDQTEKEKTITEEYFDDLANEFKDMSEADPAIFVGREQYEYRAGLMKVYANDSRLEEILADYDKYTIQDGFNGSRASRAIKSAYGTSEDYVERDFDMPEDVVQTPTKTISYDMTYDTQQEETTDIPEEELEDDKRNLRQRFQDRRTAVKAASDRAGRKAARQANRLFRR